MSQSEGTGDPAASNPISRTIVTGTTELLCEVRERVAVITLNRPQARNALSDQLTPALRTVIETCKRDSGVGALLITGSGRAFCAGGDLKGMGGADKGTEQDHASRVEALQTGQRRLTGALVALRKPTVAALPGPAVGAGLSIALACDIRIACESAFVTTGYANIGLSGDYGIAWLLTRVVGYARARELMLDPSRVTAQRCEWMGLVNRIAPDAQLQEQAFAWARALAHGPMAAFSRMKDNLDEALSSSFSESLDREAVRVIESSMTDDHREAVRAFIEKRPPAFQGHAA